MMRSGTVLRATRREVLRVCAGLACFVGTRLAYAVSAPPFADRQSHQGGITLDAPSVVEEGGSLWLTVTVDSPMSAEEFVRTISLSAELEPERRAATFHLSPETGRARVSTRLDLKKSQTIMAIAELSDGTVWTTSADVVVTHATCEDETQGKRPPVRFLARVPPKAKPGEVIEIKTLLPHPARTGEPHFYSGDALQRNAIREFVAAYNGNEIFRADLFPSISANPFLTFSTTAMHSGLILFTWREEQGRTRSEELEIVVDVA